MPTFERCSSCITKGRPADETPFVPEGTKCNACQPFMLKVQTATLHGVTARDRVLDQWKDASNADHKCELCGAPITWAWSKCWPCVKRTLNGAHGKGAK